MSERFSFIERKDPHISRDPREQTETIDRRLRPVVADTGPRAVMPPAAEIEKLADDFGTVKRARETKRMAGLENRLIEMCLRYPTQAATFVSKFNRRLQDKHPGILYSHDEQRGVLSAVDYVVKQQALPLPKGYERIISVNDELDARHAIDFFTMVGTRDSSGRFTAAWGYLVQVKSSIVAAQQKAEAIHQSHNEWARDYAATREEIVRARKERIAVPVELTEHDSFCESIANFYVDMVDVGSDEEFQSRLVRELLHARSEEHAAQLIKNRPQMVRSAFLVTLAGISADPGLRNEQLETRFREAISHLDSLVPAVDEDLRSIPKLHSVISIGGKEFDRAEVKPYATPLPISQKAA